MRSVTDAEIVSWIGRLGAVGAEHIEARFGIERDIAHKRLACLQWEGVLGCAKRPGDSQALYWASKTGLSQCGLERLGVWECGPLGFDDALQVAQTAVELMRDLPEWQVLSSREISAIEADSGEPFASVRIFEDGCWTTHSPALVLCSPLARVVPVEVQPRLGTTSSLLAICRGWVRARHISRVYWLTQPSPALAVRRAVRSARASDRIMVLDLHDISLLVASECAREEASDALD
jgi:hypothetical protein